MKRMIVAAMLGLIALSAQAQCNPPPGLTIQQFYQVCNYDLSQIWLNRYRNQMTAMQFLQIAYARYSAGPTPSPPGLCQVGQMRCRGGWVDRCEVMANGAATWWVTGSETCPR